MKTKGFRSLGVALLLGQMVLAVMAEPISGQVVDSRPENTVEVVPGADYAAGGVRRFFLGAHYRDLWTLPIHVPVLDLDTFAGGLTAVSAHTGSQTTSLRFLGADGRRYQFRSVYKTPAAGLTPDLQASLIADLLQDGASASHPAGTLVVAPLLEAVGVLYPQPTLVVMPDDPALGEFREAFAGMLATIEERPNEAADGRGGFGSALQVIGPTRLFERLDEGPADQVDVPKFLTARLIDILIGDRDRHRDNFRWALMDDSGPVRTWEPISRDHDEAFVKLDGVVLLLAARYYPQLTSFGPEYGSLSNLNWHSREVDRRFLSGANRELWDSTTTLVVNQLTDEVIESAVRELPQSMYDVGGVDLIQSLKARRDALPEASDRYYKLLAEEVEIHASNAPEVAVVDRISDDLLEVSITAVGSTRPYFSRRFRPVETKEVRINMWGGRDRVVVRGSGDPGIRLRIVGGQGADVLSDSSRVGQVRFYDQGDRTNLVLGPDSKIDRKPYEEWVGHDLDRYPPRQWGSWLRPFPWILSGPDFGVLLGAGFSRTRYGFRKSPYAAQLVVRGGIATGDGWGMVDVDGDFRLENSRLSMEFNVGADGIGLLRFYGLGNDTRNTTGTPPNFFKVELEDFHSNVSLVARLGNVVTVKAGPFFKMTSSRTNLGDGFFDTVSDTLYGAGTFGQVGGEVEFEVDGRDRKIAPTRGAYARLYGTLVPPLWEVEGTYSRLEGEVRGFLSASAVWLEPTLALRAGATKIFGNAPFQDAAYLGGRQNLRGWSTERFAGDASLSGSAELRLALGSFSAGLPADFGIFGLADVGRVYVSGDSPGGWHHAYGGGVWLAFLDRRNTLSIAVASSEERTSLYFGLGFFR